MNITDINKFYKFTEEILYKYLSSDAQIIYHYTSPEALKEIIKTKQLWLSDIHFMNDKSEIEYTKNLLIKIITYKKNINKDFLSAIRSYLRINNITEGTVYIPRPVKKQYYVASFSLAPDELSLWNYYTKNDKKGGYNIGFNVKNLKAQIEPPAVYRRVICGKIIYKETKQHKIIDLILNKFNEEYEKTTEADTKEVLIAGFIGYINTLSLFFKNEVFAAEQEFRMVFIDSDIRNPSKNKQNNEREYRILNGIFVPYVKQTFIPSDIKSITASPLIDFSLCSGLNNYLRDNDIKIKVTKSKIPLRY